VATVLSQVEVDGDDPAFAAPSKPIGPLYGEAEARRLAREHGWFVAPDAGGFRRVVPSPLPKRIVEVASLRLLLDAGVLVISAGGGGVPVVIDADGRATGVEAVVDKDLTAALLARRVGASALLLLTDVEAVFADWATPTARAIRGASPADLRGFAFAPGSMAPKVEAACEFAEATGGRAGIGSLGDAAAILRGEAGTTIAPGQTLSFW
jgi:carbamate kinase